MNIRHWVAGARPRTLPAAVVPVAIGAGAAVGAGSVAWWRVALAMVVSLALQVGVNYANDYSDGVRGTDDVRVGPVRLVASGLAAPSAVKRAAFLSFGVAAAAGLVLAASTSWWLIAVGVAAIAAAWGYTGGPRPYGYAGLGELFVFVFFGLVATVGTTYVAIEKITGPSIVMGAAAGSLSCALLVVNNLRDIPTDTAVGKRTLAVRLGDGRTGGCTSRSSSRPSCWPPSRRSSGAPRSHWPCWRSVSPSRRCASCIVAPVAPALIPVLAATGRLQLAYGAFATLGLILAPR